LCIGANTALCSAINGLLLRKLPVRDADTLVRLRYAGPNQVRTDVLIYGYTAPDAKGRQVEPTFSYPMYLELLANNRTLSDLDQIGERLRAIGGVRSVAWSHLPLMTA